MRDSNWSSLVMMGGLLTIIDYSRLIELGNLLYHHTPELVPSSCMFSLQSHARTGAKTKKKGVFAHVLKISQNTIPYQNNHENLQSYNV